MSEVVEMDMVSVKTADLIGPALDWAVCLAANGFSVMVTSDYSTDWAQGGPLIENHMAMLCYPTEAGDPWEASLPGDPDWHFGQTPLIAACRAIVAAKLGDEVRVPADLL